MKKALIVATVFKFLNFEKNDIAILQSMGYEVHCATNMHESNWLKDDGSLDYLGLHKHQIDFGRSPFSKQSIIAYKQLKNLISNQEYDLMHCHTPVAATIARLAARKNRKMGMKVVYTCHGFHFHKLSKAKDWLVYYPIEFILSFLTDMIITINQEDYSVIQKFPVKEKRYIPGVGVDVTSISSLQVDKMKLRKKYGIPENAFLILSIGELSNRKNHEVIIKAMDHCGIEDIYYIICGTGDKINDLKAIVSKLGLNHRVKILGHVSHDEVMNICHCCDVGALPSLIEGLGLAGIETLAAGKPMIASGIHGIKDYVIDDITGIRCSPHNVDEFACAIKKLYQNKLLYECYSKNAVSIAMTFDVTKVVNKMRDNYECLLTKS